MPDPPTQPKTVLVGFRASEEERARLRDEAIRTGYKDLSSLLRARCLNGADGSGVTRMDVPDETSPPSGRTAAVSPDVERVMVEAEALEGRGSAFARRVAVLVGEGHSQVVAELRAEQEGLER